MTPSHFTLCNQFPSQYAPRGLNYYIHAKTLPSTFRFYRVLDEIYRMNGRMAGLRTDSVTSLARDWLPPLNDYERDRLYDMGYNYVGPISGHPAVIWGQDVQGSHFKLIDLMTVPDLLTTISQIRNVTASFRTTSHMETEEALTHWRMRNEGEYLATVVAMMWKFIQELLYERRITKGDYRRHNDSVEVHIVVHMWTDPIVLEFHMPTGKWKVNQAGNAWINAGLCVFPELIELDLQRNLSNLTEFNAHAGN